MLLITFLSLGNLFAFYVSAITSAISSTADVAKITLFISYQRFYEIILFLAAAFCNIGSQTLLQDCENF